MSDLTSLIAELEKAEGPDRGLDLAILQVATGKPWRWLHYGQQEGVTWDKYGPGAIGNPVCSLESFTSSIDAALTLVPEGWTAWELCSRHCMERFRAELTKLDAKGEFEIEVAGHASTAALALCIAALKARAAQ